MEKKRYEIDGKIFIQSTLVYGQVKQLIPIIDKIVIPSDLTVSTLVASIGEHIPSVLAILLTEENISIKDKDIGKLSEYFEFNVPIDVIIQVIEDFFDCNPIVSLSTKLSGGLKLLSTKMNSLTDLMTASVSSQTETLPKETLSVGDSQLQNQNVI